MNLFTDQTQQGTRHDLAVAACGYETRSRYVLECTDINASKKISFGYGHGEELAFEENRKAYLGSGFNFEAVHDEAFEARIQRLVAEARIGKDSISVFLDISCFTRLRLAQIVEALMTTGPFVLDVFYSLAAFSRPSEVEPTNQFLCPVSGGLSGWTGDATKAVVLVSGLGYEQMMALGIIEHIDPYEVWLFFPQSPLKSYDAAVSKSNALLLREISESNVLTYPVMDGPVLLRKLLPLVGSLRTEYRCILMPLGPKIFAFCALLAGCAYRDVSVWRASAGKHYQPRDRLPSKHSATFRIRYE
ncbi:hypothetical protein J5226_06900 [Lysobacter sp. K5869]|uniref:hypothetical protein n=1 Tax=Lysobacter sp. K5869 TaxID=2820808 RepID=UPI001C060009|nr:hypothetical protein [Lysobacter sp. K5869]QWP78118.1 hypothetical protein J5226_06900 [Lysobacter sp. K5869]